MIDPEVAARLNRGFGEAIRQFGEAVSAMVPAIHRAYAQLEAFIGAMDPEGLIAAQPLGIRCRVRWLMWGDDSLGVLDAIELARAAE